MKNKMLYYGRNYMNKNKTRKIFLEELPRRGKLIDWKNSIGYKIKFIYEDIKDEFEIIEYDKKYQKLKIKYNDNEYYILIGNLKKCKLGNILNKHTYNFKIEIGQTFKDNKRDMIIIDRKYKRKKVIVFSIQVLLVLIFLGLWEYLSARKIINAFIFSAPSKIVKVIMELYVKDNLFQHIWVTLKEVLISFGVGFILSMILAIIFYSFWQDKDD